MKSPAPRRDRHAFYEAAVQGVEWDLDFLVRAFRTRNDRAPRTFREDFCSTAALATAWAQRHPENRAWAVDLDPEPLAWAKQYRLPWVREVADRVTLVLNAFGGAKAERTLSERTRKRATNTPDGRMLPPFTYVWEQKSFNAIDRRLLAYIHFEFKDAPRMARAFVYDWRMWTLRELQECVIEAGFSDFEVYSEGWDAEARTHTGTLHKRTKLDNDDCWIGYCAAYK